MIWLPPKRGISLPKRQRGFLLNPYRFSAPATDPNFANVISLLHGNGANGGTSFPDNSPLALTWTPSGNAQTSTAQSKFSGSSILLDGSGDYITSPSNAGLVIGTGDFTIEAFIRVAGGSGYRAIYIINPTDFGLYLTPSNTIGFYDGGVNAASAAVSNNTWYHVAATRQGTTIRLFLGGVKSATDGSKSTNYTSSTHRIGGHLSGGDNFNGNIAEVRCTKGVARYTANFTPPSAAFPNS